MQFPLSFSLIAAHAAPPDQAAFRIDYPAWLARLRGRDRRVAEDIRSLLRGDHERAAVVAPAALAYAAARALVEDVSHGAGELIDGLLDDDGSPSVRERGTRASAGEQGC